jgi:hypothetical protein
MLLKCEPDVTVALMKLFAKYKAAPAEMLEKLLDTPRMRGHLSRAGLQSQARNCSGLDQRVELLHVGIRFSNSGEG